MRPPPPRPSAILLLTQPDARILATAAWQAEAQRRLLPETELRRENETRA
jgi:hypothetical protein